MQCSNTSLLTSDLRLSQQSEPQQFCFNAHPMSDQLKACSDILSCKRSRTSGSSLVFSTLTLLAVALFKYNSTFCTLSFALSEIIFKKIKIITLKVIKLHI